MYLRPRQIFDHLQVAQKITRLSESGRQVVEYRLSGEEVFGVVSSAEPRDVERWKMRQHEISHVVIQHLGTSHAQVGDLLIKGERKFLVQALDDPAGLAQFHIYYCLERFDLP